MLDFSHHLPRSNVLIHIAFSGGGEGGGAEGEGERVTGRVFK